ncbi:hypothetical protein GX50_00467 [[Emmonsia] crescens]|uniref:Uncharacterized protein n=1 Tax=[Emmonsia] crescens TaxID=73230 RepID=A0A2B7ZTS8_9EURO|nr:hypothetical protein GX50_00467 [Emmonsia crescens]
MFLQRKTNDMLPEPNVKRSTLSALDPGFLGGTGEEKRNKVRSLDRHLEQGNTFQSMWLRSAGLSNNEDRKPPCRHPARLTTTQQSAASSQTTASQSGHDQYQEISRWSPNTSSLATSTAGGSSSRASAQHSTGAPTVNSTAATHGSAAASNTTSNTTTSTNGVDAARERTLLALEHGGQPAPPSERTGEDLISRVTRDPQAAQLMSSSGTRARDRREDEDS